MTTAISLATSFSDIFKSSFLENTTSFSLVDSAIALALALAIGLFIFFIYKKTFTGVMYSASFGVSLLAMTLITTFILLAVTSNVVLSLGMVGALSIVRFRTAVKEPLDIAFLFWAISVGIVLGAGMIPLAVVGSLVIGLVLVLFSNRKSHENPYLLVVTCADGTAEQAIDAAVKGAAKRYQIKSKTVTAQSVELTVELRILGDTTVFMNQVSALPGVSSAVLVSYNGEYMA